MFHVSRALLRGRVGIMSSTSKNSTECCPFSCLSCVSSRIFCADFVNLSLKTEQNAALFVPVSRASLRGSFDRITPTYTDSTQCRPFFLCLRASLRGCCALTSPTSQNITECSFCCSCLSCVASRDFEQTSSTVGKSRECCPHFCCLSGVSSREF